MMKLLMKIPIVILMMLLIVILIVSSNIMIKKIRTKCNFATLKNFMTC